MIIVGNRAVMAREDNVSKRQVLGFYSAIGLARYMWHSISPYQIGKWKKEL